MWSVMCPQVQSAIQAHKNRIQCLFVRSAVKEGRRRIGGDAQSSSEVSASRPPDRTSTQVCSSCKGSRDGEREKSSGPCTGSVASTMASKQPQLQQHCLHVAHSGLASLRPQARLENTHTRRKSKSLSIAALDLAARSHTSGLMYRIVVVQQLPVPPCCDCNLLTESAR